MVFLGYIRHGILSALIHCDYVSHRTREGGMESLYRLVIRRPWPILVVIFLLTLFFAYHARHIHIDSSLDSLLPDNDPERQ